MSEDKDIDLRELPGPIDLVLVGASDPDAMIDFTRQCREAGIPFAADTSWQLARMDGAQVRDLMDGAAYLFSNEYEAHADRAARPAGPLTRSPPGWESGSPRSARTGPGWTGRVRSRSWSGRSPTSSPVEPTGAGDGFRAGFLAAVAWGLSLERAVQLGNMVAVQALESGRAAGVRAQARAADRAVRRRFGPQAATGRRARPSRNWLARYAGRTTRCSNRRSGLLGANRGAVTWRA